MLRVDVLAGFPGSFTIGRELMACFILKPHFSLGGGDNGGNTALLNPSHHNLTPGTLFGAYFKYTRSEIAWSHILPPDVCR